MKNAMKKLMSLMLVAVLLVSAIPFQASADEVSTVNYEIRFNDGNWSGSFSKGGASFTLEQVIASAEAANGLTADRAAFVQANYKKNYNETDLGAYIPFADVTKDPIGIRFNCDMPKQAQDPVDPPADDPIPSMKKPVNVRFIAENGDTIKHIPEWNLSGENTAADQLLYYAQKNHGVDKNYIFGENKDGASVWIKHDGDAQGQYVGTGEYVILPGDDVRIVLQPKVVEAPTEPSNPSTPSKPSDSKGDLWMDYTDKVNKYPYEVKLRVYLKGNLATLSKSFTITESLAKDSLVTVGEIKTYLKSYYTATDSEGIEVDGIYLYEGNWMGDWAYDTNRYDSVDNLNVARKYNEINLVVVLDNAKLKTTTNTSDNPKTGDGISMAMTTLGLSSAALAAVYFFGKKKYMI